MKKFFSRYAKRILLAFMLIFALTFSACAYSDGPSESSDGVSYIGNIDGFKATYRPQSYQIEDYYYNFSHDILSELTKIFGQAQLPVNQQTTEIDTVRELYDEYVSNPENYQTEPLTYKQFEEIYRVYFIDDIRNSIIQYADNDNYMEVSDTYFANLTLKWIWNMNIGTDYSSLPGSSVDYAKIFFETTSSAYRAEMLFNSFLNDSLLKAERENFYFNYYVGKYAQSLQVAILEILLGRTPTEFTYDITQNTITPSASSLLPSLQSDYEKYTTYVGISREIDIPKITNYILDKVIGAQKFSTTNADNHFSRDDYKEIIEEYLWEDALFEYNFSDSDGQSETLGSLYDIYPTNVIKDYSANSFFISSVDGQNFAHIPSGEYQSIVMMPTKDNYLSEIWYFLVADRILNIDVSYRYYDSAANTYYTSAKKTVKTQIESTFKDSKASILSLSFYDNTNTETLFLTKPFNKQIGNGILNGNPKYMNYETSKYYKAMPSVNGFGTVSVLDETAFVEDGSSFFEMVFDVHKDSSKPYDDYSFKIGMYGLFFASQSQINDYLLRNMNK